MKRIIFYTFVCGLTFWLVNPIRPVLGIEGEILPLRLGPKRVIDHKGMQTTGPSAQLGPDRTLHLAWGGEQKEEQGVYYLKIDPNQETFSSPIKVNSPTYPVASLHEPPALAIGQQEEVYITWPTPHPNANGKPFTNLLLLSRSTDGGQTFLPPIRVNDDDAVTGHSFDHITVGPQGTVHVTWLDAREGKKDPSTYTARLLDQKQDVTSNLKLDDQSCVCCRTHVTTANDGTIYIAWRKVLPENIKETVVARSKNHGQTFSSPVIVGYDRWVFEGCPHRPATMGVDQEGRLYITWYTEGPDNTPGVYLAYSDDQGQTFSPRHRLNMSKSTFPDHPQLAVNQEGQILVTWEEQSPVRREVVMSFSLDRGLSFSTPQKLNEKKAKNPAVAINSQGQAVLVWQEEIKFPGWSTIVQEISMPNLRTPLLSSQIQ